MCQSRPTIGSHRHVFVTKTTIDVRSKGDSLEQVEYLMLYCDDCMHSIKYPHAIEEPCACARLAAEICQPIPRESDAVEAQMPSHAA